MSPRQPLRPSLGFAVVNKGCREPWINPNGASGSREGAIKNLCDWWRDEPGDVDLKAKWKRLRKEHGYRIVKVEIVPIGRPR